MRAWGVLEGNVEWFGSITDAEGEFDISINTGHVEAIEADMSSLP